MDELFSHVTNRFVQKAHQCEGTKEEGEAKYWAHRARGKFWVQVRIKTLMTFLINMSRDQNCPIWVFFFNWLKKGFGFFKGSWEPTWLKNHCNVDSCEAHPFVPNPHVLRSTRTIMDSDPVQLMDPPRLYFLVDDSFLSPCLSLLVLTIWPTLPPIRTAVLIVKGTRNRAYLKRWPCCPSMQHGVTHLRS